MNIFDLDIRGCDSQGCGEFGASRGSRKHIGVDLCCDPGTEIKSPVPGVVTKLGWPYGNPNKVHIRYVQITQGDYNYRVFYVDPSVEVGQQVTSDTVIGNSQALGTFYRGITEHIHFEIKNNEGGVIDPTPLVLAMKGR